MTIHPHFPWLPKRFWFWTDFVTIIAGCAIAVTATILSYVEVKTPWPAVGVVVCAAVAALAKWGVKACEEEEKRQLASQKKKDADQCKRMVQSILSHMRAHFFESEAEEDRKKHRVTLFVCRTENGMKHLAVFARSGSHKESTRTWPVDDNDPGKCRGVAGRIWNEDITLIISAACEWKDDDQSTKEKYAESLGITIAEAEPLNVKSHLFGGTPVTVKGQPWGVLLVDSQKDWRAKSPSQQTIQRKRLERYATLLGQVLGETEG